ncbi:MAG: hypothetical protein ABUL62_25505 [Myxococcales bacterium]
MLRITRLTSAAGAPCLRVEGRLVGDWVQVLESELARLSEADRPALDLSGVDFADQPALALLQRMTERGVALVACSPLLQSLLGRSEP